MKLKIASPHSPTVCTDTQTIYRCSFLLACKAYLNLVQPARWVGVSKKIVNLNVKLLAKFLYNSQSGQCTDSAIGTNFFKQLHSIHLCIHSCAHTPARIICIIIIIILKMTINIAHLHIN